MLPTKEDPFPVVQKEVQAAWKQLSSKFHSLANVEREDRIQALKLDLNDLSHAVAVARQDRIRFKLSEQQLLSREQFVSDMQKNIASLSNSRQSLFDGPPRENRSHSANEVFINDEMRQQERIMEHQDDQLDHLANAVERIGVMGRDMHLELEEQGEMLDGLGEEFGDTVSRMKRVRQNLDRFIEEAGPRQFCTIVSLCITFLVLTFLVITT